MEFTIYELAQKDFELAKTTNDKDVHIKAFEQNFIKSVSNFLKVLPTDIKQSEVINLMASSIKFKQENESKSFIDGSGNIDTSFENSAIELTTELLIKKYPDLQINNTQLNSNDKIETNLENNSFEKKMDEIKATISNYSSLSEEEKKEARRNLINKLSQMYDEDRDKAYDELGCSETERKEYNKLIERYKYIEEHKEEYLAQHPELDEKENLAEIEKALTAQYCEENNIEPQEIADIDGAYDKRCTINNLKENITIIKKDKSMDEAEKDTKINDEQKKITILESEIQQIVSKLSEKDKEEFEKKSMDNINKALLEREKMDTKETKRSIDAVENNKNINSTFDISDLDGEFEFDEQAEETSFDDLEAELDLDNKTAEISLDDLDDDFFNNPIEISEDVINMYNQMQDNEISALLNAEPESQVNEQVQTIISREDNITISNNLKENNVRNGILLGADEEDFKDNKTTNLESTQENLPAIVNQSIFSKITQTLSSFRENVVGKINGTIEKLSKFINNKIHKPLLSVRANDELKKDKRYNEPSVSPNLKHIDGIEIKTDPNKNSDLLNSSKTQESISIQIGDITKE